jgi:hypothetical protein
MPKRRIILPFLAITFLAIGAMVVSSWQRETAHATMEPGCGNGILALGCLALRIAYPTNRFLFAMLMNTLGISTQLLWPSTLVGSNATRGWSRRDGDAAMAIFASFVIGQFMPLFS